MTIDDFRRQAEQMPYGLCIEALKVLAFEIKRRDPETTTGELLREIRGEFLRAALIVPAGRPCPPAIAAVLAPAAPPRRLAGGQPPPLAAGLPPSDAWVCSPSLSWEACELQVRAERAPDRTDHMRTMLDHLQRVADQVSA